MNLYKMLFMAFAMICCVVDVSAMRRAYSLPVQLPQKPGIAQKAKEKEKHLQQLLTAKDVVFLKTKDNKIFRLPRWQIDHMPVVLKKLSKQKDNVVFNPLDISKLGIDSQELGLLSDTLNHIKENHALPFISSLQKDSLSMLNGASDKVGSGLLYATTSNDLLPKELRYSIVKVLIEPLNKLLEKKGYIELQSERLFSGITKKDNDIESPDGTKWISVRENALLLYDENNNFFPQELEKLDVLNSNIRYTFSTDSRMVVAIVNSKGAPLHCWDTYDKCKQYTVQCPNFIGDVEFSSDAKILIFTESDQPITVEDKKSNKLYACDLNESNPIPQRITWEGSPISLITISPNNRQLVCCSGEKIYIYNNFDSTPVGSLVATEVDDFLFPVKKLTFASDSTKFICQALEMTACLYDSNGSLDEILGSTDHLIRSVCLNSTGNTCVIKASNDLLYWEKDNDKFNNTFPPVIYKGNSIGKIKFSPSDKICAFTDRDWLCYFNVDDLYIHKNLEGSNINTKISSIVFSSDREFSILVENANSITKKNYGFDNKDLKNCSIGQAQMLSDIYYAHLLKDTNKDKTLINITKGTLSYELFGKLSERLQNLMKPVLGLNLVDTSEPIEQKYLKTKIEEISHPLAEEAMKKAGEDAMKKLHAYLEQERPRIEAVQQRIETEKKAKENKPEQVAETQEEKKEIMPLPQQPQQPIRAWQSFMQKASNVGEYIYHSLPIPVQKLIKERKPTEEEKQLLQQLTEEELREFNGDFSKLKDIIQARKNKEAEQKRAILEKAKEDMRRYFAQPRLKNAQGFWDEEAIAKTIATLSTIYQPGTVDYEAFHAVIKEMGFE